uniref:Carboxylic ester hydrolase n=1 Tax=Timema tahoe TaxID=61484 RepID=A0A7R9ISK7_9NEOP|nr:unnamed protein product [Timema tahoe]
MMWIHGGGFTNGNGNSIIFDPEFIVNEEVVFVSINYRLGVLGFLSLDGTDVSSNNGLRDQLAALKWIKQNIAQFGGDPETVTVSGQSAGGASVHYLLMSPLSQGLFQRAISESGSAFNPWAYMKTPKERALRLAFYLGYSGSNGSQEIADYLRTVDASELANNQAQGPSDEEKSGGMNYPFVPTAEPSVRSSGEVFLPDEPINLMRTGQFLRVPVIMGSGSNEAKMSAQSMNKSASNWRNANKNFENNVPLDLGLARGSEQSLEVEELIKQFYYNGEDISSSTVQEYSNMLTDIRYVKGVYKTVSDILAHSNSPLYNYLFSFDGEINYSYISGSTTTLKGGGHSDEVCYIFLCSQFNLDLAEDSPELTTSHRMVSMWTNFVKTGHSHATMRTYAVFLSVAVGAWTKRQAVWFAEDEEAVVRDLVGNPSPGEGISWLPATNDTRYYLQIDTDLSLQQDLLKDRMAFWDQIYTTYQNGTIYTN